MTSVSIRRRHLLKTDRQTGGRIKRRLVYSRDLSYALFTERIYIEREYVCYELRIIMERIASFQTQHEDQK